MQKDIIPLCLYTHNNEKQSLLKVPKTSKNGDNIFLDCENISDYTLIASFYVISPDLVQRPVGLTLLVYTEDKIIKEKYDPYDQDLKGIDFYAWLKPTPHTTPLYCYIVDKKLYISLNKEEGLVENIISPIYVLFDPRVNVYRIPPVKGGNFSIFNNIPQYTFKSFQGRCIPHSEGVSLGECHVENLRELHGKRPTVLNLIKPRRVNKLKYFLPFLIVLAILIFLFLK